MADIFKLATDEEAKRMTDAANDSKKRREANKKEKEMAELTKQAAVNSKKRRDDNKSKDAMI